jgi:hypothetical protein
MGHVGGFPPIPSRRWIWPLLAVAALVSGLLPACGSDPPTSTPDPGMFRALGRDFPAAEPLLAAARLAPARATAEGGFRLRSSRTGAVTAELPSVADSPMRIAVGQGFAVGAHRRAGLPAEARPESGAVTYREAWPGVDAILFARDESIEELLHVRSREAVPRYDIDLPPGASLRRVSRGFVELLDATGTCRLRLRSRYGWDARGRAFVPDLEVSGNSVTVVLAADLELPALIDPEWESASALSILREHGTATLLPSGRVLFAGGTAQGVGYLTSTEIFDPATGTFTAAGDLEKTRIYHTATLLRSGKVLITGGISPAGGVQSVVELFDEHLGTFTSIASLGTARSDHTATLLESGKLLIAGGLGGSGPLSGSELFDPQAAGGAGAFSPGPASAARYGHIAVRLPNGKLLLAGGYGPGNGILSSAEIYDPQSGATGSFAATGAMSVSRTRATATLLPTGKVLVAGGLGPGAATHATTELFDPTLGAGSGGFVPAASMLTPRNWNCMTLLPSGKVLLTGGENGGVGLLSAELYDPATNAFSSAPAMSVQRTHHTSTQLPSGKVLVAGGLYSTAVDVFDPVAGSLGSLSTAGSLNAARSHATATLLTSGKVLIAGGENADVPTASADLYDPATGLSTPVSPMNKPRSRHVATLLATGKVLVAGGQTSNGGVLSDAELFDPNTGAFAPTGSMLVPRSLFASTLLPSGEALVTGGITTNTLLLSSAELYDPATGVFVATGEMSGKRTGHTATLLRSGRVLLAAGITANFTAELYDRSANSGAGAFVSTGNLTRTRFGHAATLLPSGRVLLAGGLDGTTIIATSELYDPMTGGFAQTGSMSAARYQHTATMLPSGKILITGGAGASGPVSTVEVFDPGDGANGGFAPAGNLTQGRIAPTATLLPSGSVLIAGGAAAGALSSLERWTDSSVGSDAWRPQLISAPPSLASGTGATITGSRFAGISNASSGSTQTSDTGYPIAVWLPTAGGWGVMGSLSPWSDTSATWIPKPTVQAGPGWLWVITNGIPSAARPSALLPAPTAAPCAVGGECASGWCADGVCCSTQCDAPCQACSAAYKGSGEDGVCGAIAANTDPKDQCVAAPAVTCGTTGACDGAGACALYAAGTECFPASCSGPVLSPAFTCDGAGVCSPSTPVNCQPGTCQGAGPTAGCKQSCTLSSDCVQGFCSGGVCTSPQGPGAACQDGSQCLGGQCVDGVCCNSDCAQECAACVQSKTGAADGICAPVLDGTDPDDDCPTEQPSSCQKDGFCNGAFACRLYDKETGCKPASCVEDDKSAIKYQALCDGQGSCGATQAFPCGAFGCGAQGECNTTCSIDADCAPLYRCAEQGQCVPRGTSICVDERTSQSAEGNKQVCAPYSCNLLDGTCRTICRSQAGCVDGYECDSQGRCVQPFPVSNPEGCACRAPGGRSPADGSIWLAALLALAALRTCSGRRASAARR